MSRNMARERLGTAAVLAAMALVVLDFGMVNVALPTVALAFSRSPAESMLVVTAYQLTLLMGLLPGAHLADRIGYRTLFAAGVLIFAAAAAGSAMAPTLPLLVAARALQGFGGAAIMALGIALLRFTLGAERLGSAIAWNALVVAICAAAAPVVGALIISWFGWRWIFVASLPLAAAALIAARALPPVPANIRSTNLLTIALYGLAVGAIVMAVEVARSQPVEAVLLLLVGLAAAWRLFFRERRQNAPIVPFDLLAVRSFRRSVAASVLLFAGQSAGLLALPFHLQMSLSRSPLTAGMMIALWPLAVAATSRIAGRMADKWPVASVCALGGSVLAAGLAATALIPPGWSLAPLAVCMMVCGIGFGLFQVPNNRNMFLSAPPHRSAAAGGLQGTARLAGQTAGALLVAWILAIAPLSMAPQLAIGAAAAAALATAVISWSGKSDGVSAGHIEVADPALSSSVAAGSVRTQCPHSGPVEGRLRCSGSDPASLRAC